MKFKSYLALLLLVPIGFAGVWRLQERIDKQQAALTVEDDQVILRSSKLVKAMSLEYGPLLADIYWTRVVQYFGNKHAGHQVDLRLLWPLLDLTTTLDPNLLPVYPFGSTFLSDSAPRGAGRPDLAVELLERGIRANPEQWRLYYDLGYVYYFELKDYQKASEAFYEGGKNPHAQLWMKVMAAKIAAEGNSTETSLFLWQDVYNTTHDALVKENALTHLQLLRVQEDCRQIDMLSDQYESKFGHRPQSIRELLQGGFLRAAPVDPRGYPYTLSVDGKAEVSAESPLFEKQMAAEPKK